MEETSFEDMTDSDEIFRHICNSVPEKLFNQFNNFAKKAKPV
jgi:hypothetical protein